VIKPARRVARPGLIALDIIPFSYLSLSGSLREPVDLAGTSETAAQTPREILKGMIVDGNP